MNDLQVFNHNQFGELTAILIEGKPYFPATRCAEMLGYTNPRKAILDHCKGVTKRYSPTPGGDQEVNYIAQGDLIRLIMHSKLPSAEAFEKWVIEEIVPCVLRHGMYVADDLINNPDLIISALTAIKEERAKRALAEKKADLLEAKLDEASKWYSVKRWAGEHGVNWRYLFDESGRGLGWRKLKALSIENGYEIKRCFDANYGEVNLYHSNVFEMLQAPTAQYGKPL
jgi:prophage antirepressor-like protein